MISRGARSSCRLQSEQTSSNSSPPRQRKYHPIFVDAVHAERQTRRRTECGARGRAHCTEGPCAAPALSLPWHISVGPSARQIDLVGYRHIGRSSKSTRAPPCLIAEQWWGGPPAAANNQRVTMQSPGDCYSQISETPGSPGPSPSRLLDMYVESRPAAPCQSVQ